MRIIFILLIALIIFQSCKKISSGYIINKWYEPSRTYVALMPIVHSNGKMSYTTFIPYIINDTEDWCINVSGVTKKGDTITKTFYISKSKYESLVIGDFICVDGECDEDNNNTEKPK